MISGNAAMDEEFVEVDVSIQDLFNAISLIENHTFVTDEEFSVQTPIYIQDHNNKWCRVPALIIKHSPLCEIQWSNGSVLVCADKHLIRTQGLECVPAESFKSGDRVLLSSGESLICSSVNFVNTPTTVYDIQIDSPDHLYQTSDGLVHHNTHMVTTLAQVLQVPFAVVDATSLSQTGYVGLDPEECLVRLYAAAEHDLEKAQQGIIFIDEIDKIGRKSGENVSTTRDVSGEGVQQALLKIIEGSDVKFSPAGGRKNPNGEFVTMNTRNILFILGGAFEGLDKVIQSRQDKKQSRMGFLADVADHTSDAHSSFDLIQQVETEDLIQYGMIPELVGRIPVILPFENLDVSTLTRILVEPKNAIVKQYQTQFAWEGIRLEFDADSLTAIAEQVIRTKTGARGLRRVIERMLLDSLYQIQQLRDRNIKTIRVTAPCFTQSKQPEYLVD